MVLLDTKQIAEMLTLSTDHVRNRLVKSPGFPPPVINISRRTRRWSLGDVQRWLKDCAEKGRK